MGVSVKHMEFPTGSEWNFCTNRTPLAEEKHKVVSEKFRAISVVKYMRVLYETIKYPHSIVGGVKYACVLYETIHNSIALSAGSNMPFFVYETIDNSIGVVKCCAGSALDLEKEFHIGKKVSQICGAGAAKGNTLGPKETTSTATSRVMYKIDQLKKRYYHYQTGPEAAEGGAGSLL